MNGILDAAWMQPLADANLGDFVFFKLVNNYFSNEIQTFGLELTSRAMRWVSMIALTGTTFWVLIQGYLLATGQSRESAMATSVKAAKVVVIMTIASAVGVNGAMLHQTMTDNLDREIHGLFTGEEDTSAADSIDDNLKYTQLALAAIDAVRIDASDPEALEKKGRAMLFATFGTAGPPMVAGAMLLLFKFTIAFLVGVGPIFIFFLMFDQTKDLFRKWLYYLVGTLFSLSMLSAVTAMVLKFTAKVAAAYWLVKLIPLGSAEGLSSQALQQGGIGLLMTVLIVSVPPMTAVLWQGSMSSFLHFSAFSNNAAPGPQGQPPGSYSPPHRSAEVDVSRDDAAQASGRRSYSGASAGATITGGTGARGHAKRGDSQFT